jgi:hypothetical protein
MALLMIAGCAPSGAGDALRMISASPTVDEVNGKLSVTRP